MTPDISSYRTLLAPHMAATQPDAPVTGATVPRRANLVSTLARLHLLGPQSRSGLVSGLGLSRSGVGSLIGELIDLGIAEEAGVDRQPSPGRPSLVVRLDPDRAVALALEFGPGEIAVARVGLGGDVVDIQRRSWPAPHLDPAVAVATAAEMLDAQLAAMSSRSTLLGVGVAVAGLVSSDGTVQLAPNLRWGVTDLGAMLADVLPGGLPVQVGNESTYATVGEYLRGSLRGVDNGLLISGNAGVGGGAIVNGRLLAGARGLAAEVGHMKMELDGRRCGCGGRGCWETQVGLPATLLASGADMADVPDGGEVVELLAARAAAGDPAVLAALADAARWMGRGLANLVNVLNPERIVFGGRLARLLPHLRAGVEEEMAHAALPALLADCAIVEPALHEDAALIGAAEQVFWSALNAPEVLLGTPAADTG